MTDSAKDENKAAPEQPTAQQQAPEVTPLTVLGSVFRAWFGVQSEQNRQRDFSSSSPTPFIVAGIIFAIAMVVGVIIMVNIALSAAGQ